MLLPLSWLKQFIQTDLTPAGLADRLTMAGIEVEKITAVAPDFDGVVVGEILAIQPHPQADRLQICHVDVAQTKPLQIVCGAKNVRLNMKVACALNGANLPGKDGGCFTICTTTLRGIESQGMLCSASELGLELEFATQEDGILNLDLSAVIGQNLRHYLELDDHVLYLKLTPNRGDCLSVLGIAREVSSLTQFSLRVPQICTTVAASVEPLPVRILDEKLCGRFSGRIIRSVNPRAMTPTWMKHRLIRAGQKPISALVDISNYVMLERGQPNHVFDRDKLGKSLVVRWAKAGESVQLLNGTQLVVDETVGVIASDDKIVAVAGIMGGQETAITLETKNVYVEAAFWHPGAIRGRSRRFGLLTEAAHRFERGVDYECTVESLEYLTELILEICGGHADRIDDHIQCLPLRKTIALPVMQVCQVLGVTLKKQQIENLLQQLRFSYTVSDDGFVVTPPSFRFDLEITADLIEEIARLYGYHRLPNTVAQAPQKMLCRKEEQRSIHAVRHHLATRDYQEVINFSFVPEDWEKNKLARSQFVPLANPISRHFSLMRSSLLPGLVDTVRYNVNRQMTRVRVFEIGRVFFPAAVTQTASVDPGCPSIQETSMLAVAAYGSCWPEQWGEKTRDLDFFDIKGDLESLFPAGQRPCLRYESLNHPFLHPQRSAAVILGDVSVGIIGALHPLWQQELGLAKTPWLFQLESQSILRSPLQKSRLTSKYPEIIRDLAVIVPASYSVQSLLDVMQFASQDFSPWVQSIRLFDYYQKKDIAFEDKCLAFRIILQDPVGTLKDEQADIVLKTLLQALTEKCGATLRFF